MAALPGITVALGNPPSSDHQMSQIELADWMTEFEALAGSSGLSYIDGTLASLEARVGTADGEYGLVLNDTVEGGVYERIAGVWTKKAAIPSIFTSPAIAAHEARTDNPHAVTPAQIGAATQQEVAAAVGTHEARTDNPHATTKDQLGLGSVDNTSDADKPVSTAQQAALDAKAPINSPTFTGTVQGVTKQHVGLGNVDNTSDAAKPVSAAQQAAIDALLFRVAGSESFGSTPALAPDNFTSATAGGDVSARPVVSGAVEPVATADGRALRITGSGVLCERFYSPIEPSRTYAARVKFRRSVSPSDPAGNAVRAAVAWYDRNLTYVSYTDINTTALTVDDGLTVVTATITASGGGGEIEAPANGLFACLYVQTFGDDGATDVLPIWLRDVTDASAYSPDLTALSGRVTSLESIDTGARLGSLEAAVAAPKTVTFATLSDALGGAIPASASGIRVLGQTAIFDGGFLEYREVGSDLGTESLITIGGRFFEAIPATTALSAMEDFFELLNADWKPANGHRVNVGDTEWVCVEGAAVVGIPSRFEPVGTPTPLHFGSFGTLKVNNPAAPYLLSDVYSTLADAQAVYPKATALTQTVDDMACQAMVDYLRANFFQAQGGQEIDIDTGSNAGQQTTFLFPLGTYYLTRPLDLTNIEFAHTFWGIHSDGATIMLATAGKTGLDFLGSRRCVFTGACNIMGLWTADGVPRSGIQVGRDFTLGSADGHRFEGAWAVKGRFSLAPVHNYASEQLHLSGLVVSNDLDNRVYHVQFDGSDGVLSFLTTEEVTWDGGSSSGVVKFGSSDKVSGGVVIRLVTGAAPTDGDTIVGATSAKSATVNGVPVQEPSGEGPGGECYGLVQDGDNYWAITSDYVSVAAADTSGSFLGNHGAIDCRNTGLGAAMWHCRGSNHNYDDAYFVSTNAEGGAAVVAFANTASDVLTGCRFLRAHIETDEADLDATTGLDYGFEFRSSIAGRNIQVRQFSFSDNTVHAQTALFRAGTNVAKVVFRQDSSIDVAVARDVGQVMFDAPEKFRFYGKIFCITDGSGPFLNISDLANIGGHVHCLLGTSSNVRHPTGTYLLTDELGRLEMVNGVTVSGNVNLPMDPVTGLMGLSAVNDSTSAELARWQYNAASSRWELSVNGSASDYLFVDTAFRPVADNAVDLGLLASRWRTGFFADVRATRYLDANGIKVVGPQSAAVPDIMVTATVGALPAADGSITIADAAAPTNAELLEYCRELEAKLETLLARVRAHGLIAT